MTVHISKNNEYKERELFWKIYNKNIQRVKTINSKDITLSQKIRLTKSLIKEIIMMRYDLNFIKKQSKNRL